MKRYLACVFEMNIFEAFFTMFLEVLYTYSKYIIFGVCRLLNFFVIICVLIMSADKTSLWYYTSALYRGTDRSGAY